MPVGMDPTGSLNTPDFYGDALVFDGLTYLDYSSGAPVLKGALAASWTAKDPTTWEFKLRPNVKFQNGDPFTADDVKFTFDRILDPANKLPTASRLATVKQVTVVDPLTVDVATKVTDPLLPRTLPALYIVPAKYFQSVTATVFNNSKPIGTGWYKVTDYVQKDHLTLDAFDDGWHGPAKTKTVAFKSIPEEATRTAALKSGDVDMVTALATDQIASLKDTFSVTTATSGMMNGVYFQPTGPKAGPMKDTLVRQAMIQAVDKDSIAKNIMGGIVQPATQSLPPNIPGYNPDVKQEPYDVNKAKALMQQANVTSFSVEMGTTYGALVNTQQVMEAFANMESKIGVNVKITNMEIAAYLTAFRNFDRPPLWNMSLGWTPAMDGQLQFQWYQSTKGPDKFMDNQDFDKLYAQANSELDPDKRTKLLQQEEAILVSEHIGVWFFETPSVYGMSKKFTGFTPRPDQIIEVFNIAKAS